MVIRASIVVACAAAITACAVPDSTGVTGVQEGPDVVKSPAGTLAYYQGVLDLTGAVLNDYAIESGTLTDELRPLMTAVQHPSPTGIDLRVVPEATASEATSSISFVALQQLRANARQARTALAAYAPAAPKALIGHLYAIEGLADVLLADLYCSGIPLSTLNPDGSITLAAGAHTAEVYRVAVALFDSAMTLSGDSVRILDFARVGKGRALLALGSADSAAAVVHAVATDTIYAVGGNGTPRMFYAGSSLLRSSSYYYVDVALQSGVVMSDREGATGLPYASSADPRTAADTGRRLQSVDGFGLRSLLFPRYFARKYAINGTTPLVAASGVEARLIEAEADLKAGRTTWLDKLNALRATMVSPALPALEDPGTDTGRVRLLFDERGYWLFLTGHRQGDLRRLVRQPSAGGYGWPQERVYPSGPYPLVGASYGTDVTLPVPPEERKRNPRYTGCFNREA